MSTAKGKLIDETSGEVFELGDVSEIGRSRESDVVIPDPRVSRRHAMIRQQPDGFWFFDLGSINGAYINGRRVTASQLLVTGDLLRIADHQYRFEGSGSGPNDSQDETVSDATIIHMQSAEAILLVSDIQDYTKLSEQLSPDEIAPIIGSWYARTEQILAQHRANLDKFLGDSVLAYWLETSLDSRRQAFMTAAAMQRACEEVRQKHGRILDEKGLDFRSGTALHIGPTAYGAFSTKEFTLLGDAVNVVFRLEALTRTLGEPVLVSGEMLDDWEDGRRLCRPLGSHAVKGRVREVDVYAFESP